MSNSLGNGRFDIPDYDQLDDESFPPLPPPLSPGLGGDNPFADGEEDGDLSKLADAPPAKRKTIRRPQPKLDSQRLISERGLPALRTLFDNVRFKGKGHEAEDLRVVMQKMENWAHRLYPKLQFDDFMEKVERLGSKKDVQTCLKKIRLDMPLIHEDFIGRDEESETTPGQQVFEDPDPFGSTGGFPGGSQGPVHSTPAPFHSTPAPTSSPSLTEEQRRRIELNKQLALERRLSRKQPPTDLPGSQGGSCGAVSSQADSSQAISSEAGYTQASSSQADSSQVVSPEAVSTQAVSTQASSSQADSSQAVSPEAGCTQASSTQASSTQADSSQAVSPEAGCTQASSTQADSSQAVSSEAVSTQASPVHLPPDSLPPSKPCPPEPRLEDMEVEPSQEAPDYSTAKDSPASLASPQREEGEPSQPGS